MSMTLEYRCDDGVVGQEVVDLVEMEGPHGKLHMPTIQKTFTLDFMQLNGSVPVVVDDLTLGTFQVNASVEVTSTPRMTGLAGGGQQGTVGAGAGEASAGQEPPRKRRRPVPSTLTPSALAQDAGRRQLQVVTTDDLVPGFETGRDALSAPYVLPVSLMSLAFGYFEQFNRPSHALTSKEWTKSLAHAKQLCRALKAYDAKEDVMGAAVLPVLHGLMHKEDQEDFDFPSITPHCHGSGTNNCWDDGQATRPYIVRPGRSILFARLRVEFKRMGNPSDPQIELLGYQKSIYDQVVNALAHATEEEKHRLLRRYPFPTLLISFTEVDVQIFGAVITGSYGGAISVRCQHLSPKVTFVEPCHDDAAWAEMARLLHAVEATARLIDKFYINPPSTAPRLSELPKYPLPHNLLRYIPHPVHMASGKLLWHGVCDSSDLPSSNGQWVVAKYAERYGSEVHRSWARMGLAPELLLFLLPEAGRYCTILMPDLSKLGYQRVSSLDDQLRAEAKALALEKLKRVPDTEVHGDLREDNAMLGPPDESGRRDLVFIDFEWAGLEGQVRYPVSINTAAFWNGAGPGQEILKQHDRNMVESWGP